MSDPNPVPPIPNPEIEQLKDNIRGNNGEFSAALALVMSLLQKIADKIADPELTASVNTVKERVKGIPGRTPPGCRLARFDDLPAELRTVLGEGWRNFFDQQP